MLSVYPRLRRLASDNATAERLWCASALLLASITSAAAQTASQTLPTIDVETSQQSSSVPPSLAVLTAEQALREMQQTPGSVAVVPAEAYKNNSVASTIKDILDYVPGVFAQPKFGDDTRLSIRGSGLSRNFHLRGVQLYKDGIPINTSDGYGDFQEIDPTAYKFVEVWKGANALRFGANSLGGAINFVTPTGRDANINGAGIDMGSFGYRRFQANVGGANGPWDGFFTASNQQSQGFRDHSYGHDTRANGNIGYQFSPDFETRFYIDANDVRQRIPGSVTRTSALTNPEAAAPVNVSNDWQRNIDTVRIANKTTMRFDATTVEFGAFGVDRHLMHPIFQWLDYRYRDYGGFVRATDDRSIGGFRNKFVAGVNVLNGTIDAQQYVNVGGYKGGLQSSLLQKPENYSGYAENSFYVLPNVALVDRNTIPVRGSRSAGKLLAEWRREWPQYVQPVEPENRYSLGCRSDVAGLRQYLTKCRGAKLRRKRRSEFPESQLSNDPILRHQGADRHDV